MKGFVQEVAGRLPLAQAVLKTLSMVASEPVLERVWEENRGRHYTRRITFPVLFDLICEALMEPDGSGRQSFQRAVENGELTCSPSAPYKKLSRMPFAVSQALLTACTRSILECMPAVASPLPASLQHLQAVSLDGKKIKNVAKRLKPARGLSGDIYGAKLLAAQDVATGLAVALAAHPDGERSDAPLLEDALVRVRQRDQDTPRLFMADRQFGDVTAPRAMHQQEDEFLVRRNRKTSFHPDESVKASTGETGEGLSYTDEEGFFGAEDNPGRMRVRHIHLHRGEGNDDVLLVTSLLSREDYPAEDLLKAYRLRWKIETMFQAITETFCLGQLIGSTPEATLFQASLCLLLFNLMQLLQAHVAVAADRAPQSVSSKMLYVDLRKQLVAWRQMLDSGQTVQWLDGASKLTPASAAQELTALVSGCWTRRWSKRTSSKRSPPRKRQRISGGHTSVYRLINNE